MNTSERIKTLEGYADNARSTVRYERKDMAYNLAATGMGAGTVGIGIGMALKGDIGGLALVGFGARFAGAFGREIPDNIRTIEKYSGREAEHAQTAQQLSQEK